MKALTMYFPTENFDRETYVIHRAKWKVAYKDLSAEICATKIEIKNTMRSGGYAGGSQAWMIGASDRATQMLEDLKDAKARLKALSDEVAHAA